jgi:geranylgeranyl diphosphate synthase, type I
MPRSQATPAAQPGGARTDGRRDAAAPAGEPSGRRDPAEIDADVRGAVGAVLADLLRRRVEEAEAIDPTFAADLAAAVSRFAQEGGKRMRAQLLWWGARAGRRGTLPVRAALDLAAGLELLQSCALMHDDVMDGTRVRRGRPALHVAFEQMLPAVRRASPGVSFGEAAAVLAGDLALAWADDVVAAAPVPADRAPAVRAQWQALRTEMAAGQYLDLHGQATARSSPSAAVRTALLKSALYSVQRPLVLGATLAGADQAVLDALSAAGRCAGLAFQLRNDLTDVFGPAAGDGAGTGSDLPAGKPTYLMAVARRRATRSGDEAALGTLDRHVGDPELSENGRADVRRVLEATGARQAVEARIAALTRQALRRLHTPRAAMDAGARSRVGQLLSAAAGVPPPDGAGADPGPEDAGDLPGGARPGGVRGPREAR